MESNKRITKAERALIAQMINDGRTLESIASALGRHPTTISREVKRNRASLNPVKKSRFRRNPCVMRENCKVTKLCSWTGCKKLCSKCSIVFCHERCEDFRLWRCEKQTMWPHSCNRCSWLCTCPEKVRYVYDDVRAEKIATFRVANARRGIDLDASEFEELDNLITPLVKQGQSLYHIHNTNRDEIGVSLATLYNYFDLGLFSARRIDLPRAVRFKKRRHDKSSDEGGFAFKDLEGRTYLDYLSYLTMIAELYGFEEPQTNLDWDVEMDTVIGRVGGKCLLTIVFIESELFLARLIDRKTQKCVVDALAFLERVFKRHRERCVGQGGIWWYFKTILTDRGTEMKDVSGIEQSVCADGLKGYDYAAQRTSLFYCDPYSSWQKPPIEVAHTLLRRVLPKGSSFDDLTQADIDLACSHINSYTRKSLGGATPFEVAPTGFCGDGIYKALGLRVIKARDINLTSGLLAKS